MVCVRIVWWIFWRGVVCGALLGAAFGTVIVPIAGTLYGLFYGALIGLIMGAVDAFALGAVAHFFMDMNHPERIVPWLRLIGITLNLIGVGIYSYLFFNTNLITVVPPLLAAIAAFVLVPRFVKFAVHIQEPVHIPLTGVVW
ncbi:MAG: hypothetical protein GC179_11355 [Anaerolineaceae bacterium]|nr:hypothetical protein [Anaerolineaceae bacterium]